MSDLVAAQAADALGVLEDWSAPDAAQDSLRREYVAHLRAQPRGTERACLPSHLTAGCLVLSEDGQRVLLNLHAKAQRWFHFGGHLEPGDPTLAAAALREATEESGIGGLVLSERPVHLSAHDVDFCSDNARVTHLDVRYAARVPAGTQPRVSEESSAVRWFDVRDLPTDEPDMLELIELARRA